MVGMETTGYRLTRMSRDWCQRRFAKVGRVGVTAHLRESRLAAGQAGGVADNDIGMDVRALVANGVGSIVDNSVGGLAENDIDGCVSDRPRQLYQRQRPSTTSTTTSYASPLLASMGICLRTISLDHEQEGMIVLRQVLY